MLDANEPNQRGVVIVDECLQVKLWNPWLERVSGVDGYRAMGMTLSDLMPGMRTSGLEGRILDAIYTGRTAKVQAHELSDMVWAYDMRVSIKPVDTKSFTSLAIAGSALPQALAMIEFEAPGRSSAVPAMPTVRPRFEAAPSISGPKVLLLEGDATLRAEITALLQAEGCQVCEAEDGIAAVRIVQLSETFDLILADICNPVLGGFDAVMQIRSLPSAKGSIPAVALVAEGTFQDRDRLLNAGFSDYFIKSYFSKCLPRVCKNLTSKGPKKPGGEMSHG